MKLYINDAGLLDLEVGDRGIIQETTLYSAALNSLLCHRRAKPTDFLYPPQNQSGFAVHLRGWCGDFMDELLRRIGSRSWTLGRRKQIDETKQLAFAYDREALEWMIDDGHATHIEITGEWRGIGRLDKRNAIYLKDGSVLKINLIQILEADQNAL